MERASNSRNPDELSVFTTSRTSSLALWALAQMLAACVTMTAQEIVWVQERNSPSDIEWRSIARGADGRYLAVGRQWPHRDALLLLAADGSYVWDTLLAPGATYGTVMARTGGGYTVLGYSPAGTPMLVQLDPHGRMLSTDSAFGLPDSLNARFSHARSTDDGGLVASGVARAASQRLVAKFSPSGTLDWWRVFDGPDSGYSNRIRQLSDGGYAVAIGLPLLKMSTLIVRLARDGEVQWSRRHEDFQYQWTDVVQRGDGGLIATGGDPGSGYEMHLLWLNDSSGVVERDSLYSGLHIESKAEPSPRGGFVICTEGGPRDRRCVTHVTEDGTVSWRVDLQRLGAYFVRDFATLSDGRIIVIARPTAHNGYVVALLDDTPSGIVRWYPLPARPDLW